MPLARTRAISLIGLEGRPVEVQCDISSGLPGLSFTGLPDASVTEARERIRSAVSNAGAAWPQQRITIALLPADVRKVGSRFDLALAVAVLAGAGTVPAAAVADAAWIAELGLDGRLRPVRGVLPSAVAARDAGIRRLVVAPENAAEAALVPGLHVRTAEDLAQIIEWLDGRGDVLDAVRADPAEPVDEPGPDLADVAGQVMGKRALTIAAAGGHHLSMIGAPGAGKTMLAKRLPGLLPPLDDIAAMEVTAVQSVAGLLGEQPRLVRRPPFQSPHHTTSVAALVGGGTFLARPGAVSLAHHGVLLLDEAAEFAPTALDALRQPLEDGSVVLHRAGGAVRYPARFQLVLAANPCPCALPTAQCICPPTNRRRYEQRVSGPLMDRIDLRIRVDPVAHVDLFDRGEERESSAVVAARVAMAREAAAERWKGEWRVNAEVPGARLRSAPWLLSAATLRPARRFLDRGELSARGFDRVLRLAWTIADLAGHPVPDVGDIDEALHFRTGRASSWAA